MKIMDTASFPFFSVTIPAFKAKFLEECIDSVLAQTNKDFELIIVDDASPEDLKSIVDGFADTRIRYFRNEKGFGAYNVVGNWNKCLEYARGKYLICMGDDDRLLPNCLADYKAFIEKYPGLGLYHTRYQRINQKGEIIGLAEGRPEYESVYSHIWHDMACGRSQCIGDFLFEVENLRRIGGFYNLPYAWNADRLIAAYAAWETGVANTNSFGFQYRCNDLTITSSSSNIYGKIEALITSYDWFIKRLLEVPADPIDKIYVELTIPALKRFVNKFILYAIDDYIGKNPIKFFFWMFKMRSYGLGMKDVIKLVELKIRKILK
jgi:glycosyltransferase involved in cell wall biosynthesis